jgi:hypothetical protein
MSKFPFVLTLLISGTLLSWLYLDSEKPKKTAPRTKEKGRPAAPSPAPAARAASPSRIYGFPDPRSILLQLYERNGSCVASRFRSESPAFALWDDGNVVSMSPTYDYRRGRVSIAQADVWLREFQAIAAGQTRITCEAVLERAAQHDLISLRGRAGELGETTLSGPNPAFGPGHAESCADCRPIRPLARLLEEIQDQRRHGEPMESLTSFAVEVHLEWRSCGCRNHPEIVNVSKEWPLSGARPAERCGQGKIRFRLEDPTEIRRLAEAVANSAAVLDRGEIYTCFLRPLLERRTEIPLALR